MENDMQAMFNSMFDFTGEPVQQQSIPNDVPQQQVQQQVQQQASAPVQAQFIPQNKVQKQEQSVEQVTAPTPQEQAVQANVAALKNNTQQASIQSEKDAFIYSKTEWEAKEKQYTDRIKAIVLPVDVKPFNVQQCALQIDALLTELRIDGTPIHQKLDVYKTQLKYMQSDLFQSIKLQPANAKLSVDVINGLVTHKLISDKWDNTQYNIYQLIEVLTHRLIFIEDYINLLRDKKDFLITHSGMLKIENTANNFIPNVPQTNTQQQQQYAPQQPVQQQMNGGAYYGQ